MCKISFNNQNKFFFNTLNAQVEQYFIQHQLKKTGNKKLYFKSVILISTAVAIYLLLLTTSLQWGIAVALCCLFGLIQAAIGFNVMHDANHGSYSDKKWINNLMGLTANMMGVNAGLWKQKHNVIHHTYTNIDGVDIDLNKAPFLRMCTSQKKTRLHRYQHLYCIPLYALTTLMIIFISEFSNYFRKKIQSNRLRKMKVADHLIFWSSKILYIFFYLILPAFLTGLMPAIIGFMLMHITMGLTLAIVFQLAHVVEATHFIDEQKYDHQINEEWAVHQVQSTADFATDNRIISWLIGGLNFQVEHHLFPKVSHVHYPVIHKFVKETCLKFSIRHNNYPSMSSAIRSHFRFMKQLGAQ